MQQFVSRLYALAQRLSVLSWQQMILAALCAAYAVWFGAHFVRGWLGLNVNDGLAFLPAGLVAANAATALVRLFLDRQPAVRMWPAFLALVFVVQAIVLLSFYFTTKVFRGDSGIWFSWVLLSAAVVLELLLLWIAGRLLDVRKRPAHRPAVAP